MSESAPENIPGPVESAAILALTPTVDEFLSGTLGERLRDFIRSRIDALGLNERLGWLFDQDAVDDHVEMLAFCYTSAAGTEVAHEYMLALIEHIKAVFDEDDGSLIQLLCEIVLQPDSELLIRQMASISMVAPLRLPASDLVKRVLALVGAIADRAGDNEWEVHHVFCGLAAEWHKEAAHHNALIAVFECVETENESIVTAACLLKMSILLETRLKPFVLALDEAMVLAGMFKKDNRQTVGKAVKRVYAKLLTDLPEHANLVNPSWVGLRNAALHGQVARAPYPNMTGLVTQEKQGERAWSLENAIDGLAEIEDLVAPIGAVPHAISVLASEFILRFHDYIVEMMVREYEPLIEWAHQWLANTDSMDSGSGAST